MTKIVPRNIQCYICGKESRQGVFMSSNSFGSPDLDFRYAGMMRSAIWSRLQSCPYCGYVSGSLDDKTTVTKKWIMGSFYRSCNGRGFADRIAVIFYRDYLICMEEENYRAAFNSALQTAWRCDDSGDLQNAVYCRKKALEAAEHFQPDEDERERFEVRCADILRRAGMFEKVIEEYGDKEYSDETLNKIVKFQLVKAKDKDSGQYRVADAVGEDN